MNHHRPTATPAPAGAFRDRLRQRLTPDAIIEELAHAVHAVAQPESLWLWRCGNRPAPSPLPPFDPDDPLNDYLLGQPQPSPLDAISLASPALDALRAAKFDVVIPLISLGELVDVLLLRLPEGASLSGTTVATLDELAANAAAALRVADLTRHRTDEDRARERAVEEMRIAQVIQQSLLPEALPALPGWQIGAHYQPAQVVGGDLYDFIPLPHDLLAIVLGDASDKSVPAALMMAAARTLLRATAQRVVLPGQVLARVNEDLCAQVPPGVFVTCFLAILDPATGRLRYANAGQSAPLHCGNGAVAELRARGWPLGMMPGVSYEEAEIVIAPGETLVCFSDGLIEAHAADGEMFGMPRLRDALAAVPPGASLIETILDAHGRFRGPTWEQEDDLTLVSVGRLAPAAQGGVMETLAEFTLPSEEGIERLATERVGRALEAVPLSTRQRERLGTAVAETVMNAVEHGNRNRPDRALGVAVQHGAGSVVVRVSDQGHAGPIPTAPTPDLDAKLTGRQSPRGWGLFLIEHMVDSVRRIATDQGHIVELVVHVPAPDDGAPPLPDP